MPSSERKARRPAAPGALPRTPPAREREKRLLLSGACVVAGVDEAGRGALAGPVVAAAVVLPAERCPDGLDDSKRLLPGVRQVLYHEILRTAEAVAVHMTGPQRIDRINILKASHEALRGAVRALCLPAAAALVDGLAVPSFPCDYEPIVGGDGLECCIAAASIIAKVTRDHLMAAYDACYPGYGFAQHKGYGTPEHRRAIQELGLTPIHRRTFTASFTGPCGCLPDNPQPDLPL